MKEAEETERWRLISAYQPDILTRFPIQRMLPDGAHFDPILEQSFLDRVHAYQQGLPLP